MAKSDKGSGAGGWGFWIGGSKSNAISGTGAEFVGEVLLIAGDRAIDFQRPGVDAAGHVLGLFKSLLAEKLGYAEATASVVAVDNDAALLVRLKLGDAGRDLAHWDVQRAVDFGRSDFAGFAAVKENERFLLIAKLFHGDNVDFDREHG